MKRGVVFGAFDLLHPGHVLFLRECQKKCDYLTVGLHVDPSRERKTKHKPIQSVTERYIQLIGCRFVDAVVPYETEEDLLVMLTSFDFDIRFLGFDYLQYLPDNKRITGEKLLPILFIKREHNYSSSQLRERLRK